MTRLNVLGKFQWNPKRKKKAAPKFKFCIIITKLFSYKNIHRIAKSVKRFEKINFEYVNLTNLGWKMIRKILLMKILLGVYLTHGGWNVCSREGVS